MSWQPTYRHPQLGFEITPGAGWSVLEENPDSAVLAVAGPDVPRPAVVTVAAHAVDPDWDARRFGDEALDAQAASLGRIRLIDRDAIQIAGLPAAHVLLQRPDDHGEVAVLEEWRLVQGARGWVISAYTPMVAYAQQAALLQAMAATLTLPAPADPPLRRPAFDAASGVLSLTDDELTALRCLFEGDTPASGPLAALRAGGVVAGDVIQPGVADMLALIAGADVKLTVERGETVPAVAFWRERQVALILIQPDDGRQLITLDINRLPGLVADLLDLGPRRTAAQRPTLQATVTEFAAAFTQPADSESPDVATTVSEVVGHRRDHWRLLARFNDPEHYALLEAIDAPGGWWLLRPSDDGVILEPTTAATLWTHLAELAGESANPSAL